MYAPQEPSQPETPWPPGPTGPPAMPTSGGYARDATVQPQQAQAVRTTSRWLRIALDKPLITPALIGLLFLIYIPMFLSPDINERVLEWGANMHVLVMQGDWYR